MTPLFERRLIYAEVRRDLAAGSQGNHMKARVLRSPVQTVVSRHTAALLEAEAKLQGISLPGLVHRVLTVHCEALELFAAGHSLDAIAAKQGRTKANVAREIGAGVDREAGR